MSLQAYHSRMPFYGSILNSDVFNFLIGPSRTRFGIHKALLAAHSDVLKRVLDGQMREASQNEMVLEDVEEDCFACFSEYLYTGKYPVPRPRELYPALSKSLSDMALGRNPNAANIGANGSTDGSDDDAYSSVARGMKTASTSAPKKKAAASRGFAGFGGSTSEYGTQRPNSPQMPPHKSETHDFTNVFITLAGLYVLAEKYNIQYLKHLALTDLSNQLKYSFELIPSRRGDIVELIRYTYNNTYEPPCDPRTGIVVKEEGLRSLVSNYAALNLAGLRPRTAHMPNTDPSLLIGGFDELISDGGDFIKDLIRKVAIDEDENRRYGNSLLDIPAYNDGFVNGEGRVGENRSGMRGDNQGSGMEWPF